MKRGGPTTGTTDRPDVDLVVECVHCGDVATLTGWTDATEVAARRLADEHLAERHSDDLTVVPVFP